MRAWPRPTTAITKYVAHLLLLQALPSHKVHQSYSAHTTLTKIMHQNVLFGKLLERQAPLRHFLILFSSMSRLQVPGMWMVDCDTIIPHKLPSMKLANVGHRLNVSPSSLLVPVDKQTWNLSTLRTYSLRKKRRLQKVFSPRS